MLHMQNNEIHKRFTVKVMNICIGGDLDGQVIDQEGRYLKLQELILSLRLNT
jgi:hypothetical protein